MEVLALNSRIPTPEDEGLPWVDYSTLKEIEACPMRGIVKYVARKWPETGRDLSLDAGNALHTAFAAYNAWTIGHDACVKLFGPDNSTIHARLLEAADAAPDFNSKRIAYAIEALHTASGFVDSPDDPRRTMNNLENAFLLWESQQRGADYHPPIACEEPFEIVLDIEYTDDRGVCRHAKLLYIGRIDKRIIGRTGMSPVDYKTTTIALDRNYECQYFLSSQLIGYRLALMTLFPQEEISPYASIEAIKIPVSAKARSFVRRGFNATNIEHFAHFVIRNYQWIEMYNVTKSLRSIEQREGSCHDWFRECPLLTGLCTEDRNAWNMIVGSLPDYTWDPRV